MALNPPLTQNGEPYRIDHNEFFILHRKGIEFQIKVDGLGKMSGQGIVRTPSPSIIPTARLDYQ